MTRLILLLALVLVSLQAHAATIRIGDILNLTDLGPNVKPKAINNNGQIVGQDATGQEQLGQPKSSAHDWIQFHYVLM